MTDIQAICPGDKECESAILKIREKLELDIVEAGLAEGQRRNEQRSRRATTVVQTMQSVVALALPIVSWIKNDNCILISKL